MTIAQECLEIPVGTVRIGCGEQQREIAAAGSSVPARWMGDVSRETRPDTPGASRRQLMLQRSLPWTCRRNVISVRVASEPGQRGAFGNG